ncbi:hypothetical protein GIB67_003655 [Kingdonia uniflora]|uniref:Protein FAR1-RELATED SEQUENCE n=1 Tax=Kingdonia uniflora TaxID=39325 RepID=A0A7J7M3R0_9MAGN|nr:hypothetical protein GIB67_003655 [Kingdonia uniflora]
MSSATTPLSMATSFTTKPSYPFLSHPSKPINSFHLSCSYSSSPPPFSWMSIKPKNSITPLVASTSDWAQQVETEAPVSELEGEEEEETVEGESSGAEETYAEPPEEAKLFVGNLSFEIDSEKLAQLFDQAGVVEVAEVIYNRETDQSRGFGFVTMSTVAEAEKAVEIFHRYDLNGRLLTVNKAAPRGSRPERAPRVYEPSFKIYVGNLPWQVDDASLEQTFSEHGKVVEARVVYDRESGRSRGFGFVTMSTQAELNDAIAALDGTSMDGRPIRVNAAEDRPRPLGVVVHLIGLEIALGKNPNVKYKVFPNTRHRLCLWHIIHKFPEKIGHVYRDPSTFKSDIDSIIHNTYDPVDFDRRWAELMKKHNPDDNNWMQGLFNIRERWIPLWNRGTFYAGMSTTGRSESTNNFFNGWLLPSTGLCSFVTKYATTLLETFEREKEEGFQSEHRYRQVRPHQALLKHAAKIYTRKIFHKVEDQFNQIVRFIAIEKSVGGNVREILLKSHSGLPESFELKIDLASLTGHCECKLFEYVGLPCCHLFKVFSKYDVIQIPDAFILPRWKIGANKYSRLYEESFLDGDNLRKPLRHNHLSLRVANLFERASKNKANFEYAISRLDELETHLDAYDASLTQISGANPSMSTPLTETVMSSTSILDPLVAQTKGHAKDDNKKGGRWKGGMEIAVEKRKRTCKACGFFGSHDKRTCPKLKLLFQKAEAGEYRKIINKYFPTTSTITTYVEYY